MPDFPREDLIGINIRVSCSRPDCAPQHPCPGCLEIIGDAGTPCPHCGTLLKPKPGTDGQAVDLVDGAGQPHDCLVEACPLGCGNPDCHYREPKEET